MSSYLSDFEKLFFGESVDEQSENVLDHIIRRILLHPTNVDSVDTQLNAPSTPQKPFQYLWSDAEFLHKIYDDHTFPQMVQKIYTAVLPQCFKTTTSISQKITLTKSRDDHAYDLIAWTQYVNLLSNIHTKKDMAFKEKEMFLWSFCVVIATKIKYLELSALLTTKEATTYKSTTFEEDRRFHFRALQGLIQKFVLELCEPSASRSLWEWHDNLLNDTDVDLKEYDEILRHNGEYILRHKKQEGELTPYSFKPFTYPNIRYVRKCAANLLLDERLTAKQLFEIHKLTLPVNTTPSVTSRVTTIPTASRLLELQSLSADAQKSFDIDFEDEVLTDNEKNTFKMVFETIFRDTLDDPKSVQLKKLLENAILKQAKETEEKEQELEDAYNDASFVAFRCYFTDCPEEFSTKRAAESICNKFDVLLLRLGIEYGFNLRQIKKLLYHYKKYVHWEFRRFFKAKIRVLIRMKYLCTLILGYTHRSHFTQSIMIATSIVFRDGFECQQHFKYCARFDKFELYRHPISTPKSAGLEEIDEKRMEDDAIAALGGDQDQKHVSFERGMTIVVKHLEEEKTPAIKRESVHVAMRSASPGKMSGQRMVVHRKRSSFDVGDNQQFESIAFNVVVARDIQQEIRDSIHFYEMYELEDDITRYIIQKIRVKTDRRVIEGLWMVLIVILSQLPLSGALRLLSRHWDAIRDKQISNVKFIRTLVETIIGTNSFPIATALLLSAWLEERAEDDITRRDAWLSMAAQCEEIAEREVEKINSDHVLCLLLYAPTDIQLISTLNLAIRYNRVTFLHHPYITGVLESIWSNGNAMMADPLLTGSLFDFKVDELRQELWANPTQFIYSAFGLSLLHSVLYLASLVIITWFATVNRCENLHLAADKQVLFWEWIILAVVVSLIFTEFAEFFKDSQIYLSKPSNLFDFITCWMWLTIVLTKAWTHLCLYAGDSSACIPDESRIIRLYHSCWALVMLFMYIKIPVTFQYTALMGRFLKTWALLVRDIFTFLVTAAVFFLGFLFCLYIMGASASRETGTSLDTLNGTGAVLYDAFFTLSGPSDLVLWHDHTPRHYWITGLLITYQILAAVLLLNLLIAMMSDTYRNVTDQALAQTNFYKIEQTTSCVQPYGRLIGAFSLVIAAICFTLNTTMLVAQFAVYCCCTPHTRWLFDVNRFETWRWMYEDFCVNVCCCCHVYPNTDELMEAQHKSANTDVHDWTQSELHLSATSEFGQKARDLVFESALYDMSPDLGNLLVIENDYRANDISGANDRKRCCFCCIKQRAKSAPLKKQIEHYLQVQGETANNRTTLRQQSMPLPLPVSGKIKDKDNLLYTPHDDDDDDSDAVDETSYLKARQTELVVIEEAQFKKYDAAHDKKLCRQTLERNRRLNKVRGDFKHAQSKQRGIIFGLKEWYNGWDFVDNETFCPNCFIGSPTRSIQEYGTVDGFIAAVEKRFEYVIKRSDRMVLRRALKDSILCQRCFYPLHCNTFHDERKTRFQIMVEIMSTYFYYLFMWIPMLILIFPFGKIGKFRNKTKKYGSAQSLLWQIEETKNFHHVHDILLPDHKYQINKSANSYHNVRNVSFDSDND